MELDPEVAEDYAFAMVGGGVPSTYHLASAIYRGDMEEAAYYAKLELAVLGSQYSILRFLNWYSPKNAISFHHMHSGMSFIRSRVLMNPVVAVPAVVGASAYLYSEMMQDQTHPYTVGRVQEQKAGVLSLGGAGFY
jgi:hypothetical protein